MNKSFHQVIPTQEPAPASWLSTQELKRRIAEAALESSSLSVSDYIEKLPSLNQLTVMCEQVALSLGLTLDFEDAAAPNSDKRDLIFWWE